MQLVLTMQKSLGRSLVAGALPPLVATTSTALSDLLVKQARHRQDLRKRREAAN
jgi:hypothetical protein